MQKEKPLRVGAGLCQDRRQTMDIKKTSNGTQTTLALSGRLDTVTAPQLEEALGAVYDSTTELILDFSELLYLSSAGLRVLLAAQKKMNQLGSMKVKNVNPTIQDVFEITGFSNILTIE